MAGKHRAEKAPRAARIEKMKSAVRFETKLQKELFTDLLKGPKK